MEVMGKIDYSNNRSRDHCFLNITGFYNVSDIWNIVD